MFEDYCKMQDFFANRYCKMQEKLRMIIIRFMIVFKVFKTLEKLFYLKPKLHRAENLHRTNCVN